MFSNKKVKSLQIIADAIISKTVENLMFPLAF